MIVGGGGGGVFLGVWGEDNEVVLRKEGLLIKCWEWRGLTVVGLEINWVWFGVFGLKGTTAVSTCWG